MNDLQQKVIQECHDYLVQNLKDFNVIEDHLIQEFVFNQRSLNAIRVSCVFHAMSALNCSFPLDICRKSLMTVYVKMKLS
jgi:hypothetical protein